MRDGKGLGKGNVASLVNDGRLECKARGFWCGFALLWPQKSP